MKQLLTCKYRKKIKSRILGNLHLKYAAFSYFFLLPPYTQTGVRTFLDGYIHLYIIVSSVIIKALLKLNRSIKVKINGPIIFKISMDKHV